MFYAFIGYYMFFIICEGQDLYPYYSTLTAYGEVRGEIDLFKGCDAQSIWMLVRNGPTYPNKYQISHFLQMHVKQAEIIENHEKYHVGELTKDELNALRAWSFNVNMNQSRMLTNQGRFEIQDLGERIRLILPQLFTLNSPVTFNITSLLSSNESAAAFLRGGYGHNVQIPHSAISDQFIMNEKNCSAWLNSIKSDKLEEEITALKNSNEMKILVNEVKIRLGYFASLNIDFIQDMYLLCAYENAWYPEKKSPWCAAFRNKHLQILEYYMDVTRYYKSGYGNPLTKKIGCSFLLNMTNWLTSNNNKSQLIFGHSLEIHKLLVSLGIANGDSPLDGSNYSNFTNREWRTSYLNPFSANIMAVKYKCKNSLNEQEEETKIAIYLNENLIKIPACGDLELCDVKMFVDNLSDLITPSFCNREFCNQ